MRCGVRFRFSTVGQGASPCAQALQPRALRPRALRPPKPRLMSWNASPAGCRAPTGPSTGQGNLELKVAVIDPVQDRARRRRAFKRTLDKGAIAKSSGLIFGIVPDLPRSARLLDTDKSRKCCGHGMHLHSMVAFRNARSAHSFSLRGRFCFWGRAGQPQKPDLTAGDRERDCVGVT